MCLFIYFLCHCQSRRRVGHGGRWPLGKGGGGGVEICEQGCLSERCRTWAASCLSSHNTALLKTTKHQRECAADCVMHVRCKCFRYGTA